jgi:hypothetical protein
MVLRQNKGTAELIKVFHFRAFPQFEALRHLDGNPIPLQSFEIYGQMGAGEKQNPDPVLGAGRLQFLGNTVSHPCGFTFASTRRIRARSEQSQFRRNRHKKRMFDDGGCLRIPNRSRSHLLTGRSTTPLSLQRLG